MSPTAPKSRVLRQVIAWAALLVLTLGLPRLFVICVGPHGDAHVAVLHTSGGCCAHDGAEGEGSDLDGDVVIADHGGCVDVALGVDTAPLPKAKGVDLQHQTCTFAFPPVAAADQATSSTDWRPPSTGPPRVDRRTALLATTVLRL